MINFPKNNPFKTFRYGIFLFLLHVNVGISQTKVDLNAQKIKNQSDSLFMAGNYLQAQKGYLQLFNFHLKNKNLNRAAEAKSDISVLYFFQSDFKSAISHCKDGLTLLPKGMGNDTIRFRINRFLGLYYSSLPETDSSAYFYQVAQQLAEKSKLVSNNAEIIGFYNDLGIIELKKVNLGKAEKYFKKAESSFHLDKTFDQSIIFNNLGRCYLLQKKYIKASEYYDLAIKKVSNYGQKYLLFLNAAFCEIKLNNPPKAQELFDQSWAFYKKSRTTLDAKPDVAFLTAFHLDKGVFYQEQKQFDLAQKAYWTAIKLSASQTGIEVSECYKYLAEISQEKKQIAESLKLYQKAMIAAHSSFKSENIYFNPPLKNILYERELFRAFIGKASALQEFYNQSKQFIHLKLSLETSLLAIELGEKMRRSYETADAKLFFTENYQKAYADAIETAYLLYERTHQPIYQQNIFDLMEKSKATALADAWRETDIKPKTVPTELLTQEKTLHQVIVSLEIALKKENDVLKKQTLNEKLATAQVTLLQLKEKFEKDFPNYYYLKYKQQSVPIQDIQRKLLNSETALIEFFINQNTLFIFTITHNKSTIYKHNISTDFKSMLNNFRLLIAQNPMSKVYIGQQLSAQLYQQLITPIFPLLKDKKRIIFIRDGELNNLPFEVLAPSGTDYLLKHFAISYGYSTNLLFSRESKQTHHQTLAFAPFADSKLKSENIRDKSLRPLPASEGEVSGISGDVYLNDDATKSKFLETYQSHGIIHLATHATTDDHEPNNSFIAFYPDNQDYKLVTQELYDLDLSQTQLVVLSACEAGRGKLQKGEGVISLARAFAYAGCPSVITTLWNAHDETTANISERLYQYLRKGLPTDEALRMAKLDFLQSDLGNKYEHPYYWANFILIGKSEKIEDYTTLWLLIVSGLILLGILGSYFYRKRILK